MNELVKYYSKNNPITLQKYKEIDGYYQLSSERLLEKYNQAFLSVFRRAYKHSPFYNKLYSEHGIGIHDIKDLTDIRKLPVISRNLIKDRIEDIFNGLSFLRTKGLTSGTSGTPLTVYRTPVDIATEQAYILHYRDMFGYKLGQPMLSVRGALGKSQAFEHYKKANILYISSPDIKPATIDMYYKMIVDFQPVALEAYPSYLNKLCLELEKKGLPLHIPNSFTSSEMLYQFQRERAESYLGTKVHDWYGNAERTIALAQDATGNYYPLPLYSINEFESKGLITTGLINCRFPLIRYQVTDTIEVEGGDFLQNIVAPRIKFIDGRAGDNIDMKDGSVAGCLDHAFKGVNHIEMAQMHQYDVSKPIIVKLVKAPGFVQADEDQLRANFKRILGDMEIQIESCRPEDLTYSKSGKFNLIIKKKPSNT